MRGEASPNHDFWLGTILAHVGRDARVLDFGCGTGQLVKKARAAGMDCWGTDTFDGNWEKRSASAEHNFIQHIELGVIPFPDDSFDAIVSNQVFEHISPQHLKQCVCEIARVLRPDGVFLALFPTRDVRFEGHNGFYFSHWMNGIPRLQRFYLAGCHWLGFGYHRRAPRQQWVSTQQRKLHDGTIVYRRARDIMRLWEESFGSPPLGIEIENLRFRLRKMRRLRRLADAPLEPIYRFVYVKRAGRVLLTRKYSPAGRARHAV